MASENGFSVHYGDGSVYRLYAFNGLYEADPDKVAEFTVEAAIARMVDIWEGERDSEAHIADIRKLAEDSPMAVRIMAASCS